MQGALQFQTDVSALFSILQPYTARPSAHFRELAEACTLLTLEPEAAAALAESMSSPSAAEQLKRVSISRLSPEQALCVLQRRLYY